MNRHILLATTSVLSAAAGTAIGYFISKKRLEATYEQRLDEEIAATVALLNTKFKQEMIGTALAEVRNEPPTVETLQQVVTGLRYGPAVPVKEAPTTVARNVFLEQNNDDPDEYTDEVAARGADAPYVISIDEYMEGARGYSQVTLTYFAEDDTLIDEGDVPLDNVNRVVGDVNLDRFGHRSGDPRVVYIRNEKLGADYEVLLHEGSFSEVVHGQTNSPPRQRPRKMRKE